MAYDKASVHIFICLRATRLVSGYTRKMVSKSRKRRTALCNKQRYATYLAARLSSGIIGGFKEITYSLQGKESGLLSGFAIAYHTKRVQAHLSDTIPRIHWEEYKSEPP